MAEGTPSTQAAPLLDEPTRQLRQRIGTFLQELQSVLARGRADELAATVGHAMADLNEPFLFVVVGEVKSGKSSFINALLEEEICAVDAAPCTDSIQKIEYGERAEVRVNDLLKRITRPIEILQKISIVDTPGTNSIIEQHQQVTEGFIPRSDLVLFVFPAKNPHNLTAWKLLDFVREEWRKRAVFILQQADLARPNELETNIRKVDEYARAHGIARPIIFATSAVRELEGEDGSGFAEVRHFIRSTVTGGEHARSKLLSILATGGKVLDDWKRRLEANRAAIQRDEEASDRIRARIARGGERSGHDIQALVDHLVRRYDEVAGQIKREFEAGLSIDTLLRRAVRSLFRREESVALWIESLQKRFSDGIETLVREIAEERAQFFVDGVRQLLSQLIEEVDQLGAPVTKTGARGRDDLMFRIAQQRAEVLEEVRNKLRALMDNDAFADMIRADPGALAPGAMGGGALAVVGTVIFATTHAVFLDITGGLLTAVGLSVAAGLLIFRRRHILREFDRGLDQARGRFETEVHRRLKDRLQLVMDEIDRSFSELHDSVQARRAEMAPQLEATAQLVKEQLELENDVNNVRLGGSLG